MGPAEKSGNVQKLNRDVNVRSPATDIRYTAAEDVITRKRYIEWVLCEFSTEYTGDRGYRKPCIHSWLLGAL